MQENSAWMIGFKGEERAAVGDLELVHVLPDRPQMFPVLKAPTHCSQVFLWEGHVLPVFDLFQWLSGESGDSDNTHLAVFRYRPAADGSLNYGSLVIEGAPRQVSVNDSQGRDLPESHGAWRRIAHACFDFGGHAVPVLNLRRIFAAPL